MRSRRTALLATSCLLVVLVLAGGVLAKVGAAESGYRQVIVFSEALSLILDNYVDPLEQDQLLRGAYEGMLGGLDVEGAYLSTKDVAEWKRPQPPNEADPGISVLKAYGALQVVAVADGSPAKAAGLSPGDQIRRVDGRTLRGLSQAQGLRLLRGEPGTSVKLSVLHPHDAFRREDLVLKRVPRTEAAYRLDVDGNVAVVKILDLKRLSADALDRDLRKARSKGTQRLLLDLRSLTEGGPREAARLIELFTSGDLLVLKDRSGRKLETLKSGRSGEAWPGPIATLVNGGTAGGAEAVATVLRSRRDATIYGEPTFGLGAEPKLFTLEDGSGFLMSAYVWETASGQGWQGEGLQPDKAIRASGKPDEADADQLRRTLQEFAAAPAAEPARKAA